MKHILQASLIILILPLLVLSIYNQPAADDFCYASKSTLMGFWDAQADWYFNWSGRFFSTAILSIIPDLFERFIAFKVFPILLVLLLFSSFYALIKQVMTPSLPGKHIPLAALSLLVCYLYQMPSLRDGLYWMASSVTYQLSNIFLLFLFSLLSAANQDNGLKRPLLLTGCLLSIAIAGSNETVMLILILSLSLVLLFELSTKKKFTIAPFIFFLISIGSSLVVIMAPGNLARLSQQTNSINVVDCLFESLSEGFYFILLWIGEPILLLFTFIAIPYIWKTVHGYPSHINIHPLASIMSWLLLIIASLIPSFFSLGHPPPKRALNVTYLLFLTGWFFNLYMIITYYFTPLRLVLDKLNPSTNRSILFLSAMYLVYSFCLNLGTDSNITRLYKDLAQGNASRYSEEVSKRHDFMMNHNDEICIINDLNNRTELLPIQFLSHDPDYWLNSCLADYFGKKKVLLRTLF